MDEEAGRFIVANEEIKPNEAIHTEQAFTMVPVADNVYLICTKCAKANINTSKLCYCKLCFRTVYCGKSCFDSHAIEHKFECYGYQVELWEGLGIAHLAFRTLMTGINDVIRKTDDYSTTLKFWNEIFLLVELEPSFLYGQILELNTNFDKMTESDFYRYSLVRD